MKIIGLTMLMLLTFFNSSCSSMPTNLEPTEVCLGSIIFYDDDKLTQPVKHENLIHLLVRGYVSSTIKQLRDYGFRVTSHKISKEKAVHLNLGIYYYLDNQIISFTLNLRAHSEISGQTDKYLWGLTAQFTADGFDQDVLKRVGGTTNKQLLEILADRLKH